MNVKLITIGKIKHKFFKEGMEHYQSRVGHYCQFSHICLDEKKIINESCQSQIDAALDAEAEAILSKVKPNDYVIILDVQGKHLDNYQFKDVIDNALLHGKQSFVFIIGSSHGLSEKIKQRAQLKWSFSKLTFLHQMMPMILLEQIYRTFKIRNNENYHK